jgi:ribosomal protein S17E
MGDDQKWVYVDRTKAIQSMVEKSYDMLSDTYQENKEKISTIKQEQFDIFQDKMQEHNKDVMRKLKTDVEVMILNG